MHRAILCLLFVKIFHRLNGMQVAEQADEILRMERANGELRDWVVRNTDLTNTKL